MCEGILSDFGKYLTLLGFKSDCGIIQVVEIQGYPMSEDKKNNSKEPVDESKVDWSTLGEDWGKLYYGNDKTPPELNKPLSPNELMEALRKIKD